MTQRMRLCGTGVGVHLMTVSVYRRFPQALPVYESHLSLATSQGDVHETAGVRESLLSAALRGLGLLLGLDLL